MNEKKWEQVEDLDYARRKIKEWANIYNIELVEFEDDGRLWSEYEWAYRLFDMKYNPIIINWKNMDEELEKFSEKEMRAMELRRDVFMGATLGEKELLKEKYIETEWCRERLSVLG